MRKLLISFFLSTAISTLSAQEIVKPGVKTPTTFAIVIDKISYEKARDAVDEYKKSIEQDGLGTWLFIDNWSSPDAIKKLLVEHHADHGENREDFDTA